MLRSVHSNLRHVCVAKLIKTNWQHCGPAKSPLLRFPTVSVRAMTDGYTYRYPRPGLTVDAVIVTEGVMPEVLLIKRKNDPFAGGWALPGGFVDENEALDAAAARELEEETGLTAEDGLLTQVGAFGDPGRDPRGWCVSVAYGALIPENRDVKGADDAAEAKWWPLDSLPKPLAFDHKLILRAAFRHLAAQLATRKGISEALQLAADQLGGPWQQQ